MLGSSGLAERRPELFCPYIGHLSGHPNVMLLQDASLMMVAHARGHSYQLDTVDARVMRRDLRNVLFQNISEPRRIIYEHLVHHQCVEMPEELAYREGFPADWASAYRSHVLQGRTWRNDWFITLIQRPDMLGLSWLNKMRPARRIKEADVDEVAIRSITEAMRTVLATLDEFHPRLLGYRDGNTPDGFPIRYSEIAESVYMMRTADWQPIEEPCGMIGGSIYDSEPQFAWDAFDLNIPGLPRVGACLSFKNYPARSRPGTLNGLLSANYPVVLYNCFECEDRVTTEAMNVLKRRQMRSIDDMDEEGRDELRKALSEVSKNIINEGMHDLGVTVFAENGGKLDANVGHARKVLLEFGGPKIVRESAGLEAAYWRVMPGQTQWRTRHGRASTKNVADWSSLESVPHGLAFSEWGPSTLRLIMDGCGYDLGLHVSGVPHAAITGKTRSGKTVLLGEIAVSLEPVMGERGLRVLFDKDRGNMQTVELSGGRYLVLRRGGKGVLAPHKAWPNTSGKRAALYGLYRGLIQHEGYKLDPASDEEGRLMRGINRMMAMPAELRTMTAVREFLGYGHNAAGYHFEKWCESGPMGWLLANDEHLLDWSDNGSGFYGFDFTELMPKEEGLADDGACKIAASVILGEMRDLMDGRRIFVGADECRFYLDIIGDWLDDMSLTGGKREVAVWMAAQYPGHFLQHPRGRSILAQCATKIGFPDPGVSEQDLVDGFGYTPQAARMVKVGMRVKRDGAGREGARKFLLWRGADDNGIVEHDLSAMPEHLAVLSAKETSLAVYERARRDDGPVAHHRRFLDLLRQPKPTLIAAE